MEKVDVNKYDSYRRQRITYQAENILHKLEHFRLMHQIPGVKFKSSTMSRRGEVFTVVFKSETESYTYYVYTKRDKIESIADVIINTL